MNNSKESAVRPPLITRDKTDSHSTDSPVGECCEPRPLCDERLSSKKLMCEQTISDVDCESATVDPDNEDFATSRRNLLRNMGLAAVMTSAGLLAAGEMKVDAQQSDNAQTAARSLRKMGSARVAPTATAAEPLPALEVIALNRMAFGPRPGDLGAFLALGNTPDERLQAYVDQQLDPEQIDDSACDAILAQQGYATWDLSRNELWVSYAIREGEENKDNDHRLPVKEVEKATFLRAIHSKRQLVEVLADFWHNHFNVNGWNRWEAPMFRNYDRDVIRAHMLGNFREMVEAVAKSPAMIYYLDNQSNTGGTPNENFARELIELHTMGAENYLGVISDTPANYDLIYDENGFPKGYVDDWVYGATASFSGWQIDKETGDFYFNVSDHFSYHKVFLGQTIPPDQEEKDGQIVLDLLVNHPGTARHVARKLCRRFISDNPPEAVVQAAADVFAANIDAPDQLTKVVRTILLSDEFKTTWGEKIKRPFEYAVSMMRSINYDFEPRSEFFWRYDTGGQPLFAWPAPDGFPDTKDRWTGTMSMLQRMRLCNYLIDWKYAKESPQGDVRYFRPEEVTPASIKTPIALVDFWSNRILGRALPNVAYQELVEFMADGRSASQDLPQDDINERLRYMIALVFMSSTFMLR